MRTLAMMLVAALFAGCQTGVDRRPPPPPEAPDPHVALREHMRDNYDLTRGIERLLLRGHVEESVDFARVIAAAPAPAGTSTWAAESAAVRARAGELAESPSTDEALRRYARLGAACATCHRAAGASTDFGVPAPRPPDLDTVEARMARHRWATARLWDGAIGGDDDAWRGGLEVLAATPVVLHDLTERAGFARRLQALAETALRDAGADVLERTRVHGELLVLCAACHAVKEP